MQLGALLLASPLLVSFVELVMSGLHDDRLRGHEGRVMLLARCMIRTMRDSIRDLLKELLDQTVDRSAQNDSRFRFIKVMQLEILKHAPKMDPHTAWTLAVDTFNDFLAETGIQFGDLEYDWSQMSAVALIHQQEIDHWNDAG